MTKFFGEKGRTLNESPLSGSLPARASQGERGEWRDRCIQFSEEILPIYFYGVLGPLDFLKNFVLRPVDLSGKEL